MKLWHKKSTPALAFRPGLRLGSSQALEEPPKLCPPQTFDFVESGAPALCQSCQARPVLCLSSNKERPSGVEVRLRVPGNPRLPLQDDSGRWALTVPYLC